MDDDGPSLPINSLLWREMSSSLKWLDYSEHERRKVLDLVTALSDKDTRDELGLGTIRDAFADAFFPGTSTVMTRARYFLFIPWIYLDLEKKKVPSSEIAARARRSELTLIEPLVASDPDGAIGRIARKGLQRLPSDIYWQGLGVWGVRLFPGSQDQYYRWIDTFYEQTDRTQRNDDGEPVEGYERSNWHRGLPDAPGNFPEIASFRLRREESEYLRERILAMCPATLLAFLVDRGRHSDPVQFPWDHPQFGEFPTKIRVQLNHARNFSEAMWGAALLYNLMLAETLGDEEGTSVYRDFLQKWAAMLEDHAAALADWNHDEFWALLAANGCPSSALTRFFVETWLQVVPSPGRARRVAESVEARTLVHQREQSLKHNRARLDNRRYLELWGGAAGTAQLNYRWRVSQRIITDILQGLHVQ